MKNKLLFSTALVAASLSFAMVANADTIITDAEQLKTEDGSVKVINDTVYTTLSEVALENDVKVTGQLTLHNAIVMAGNKNLEVDGFLTETNSGSDLSGVNLAITTESDAYDKGIIIGNDLTIGDATLANKSAIAAYYTEEEYANNPAKTLTVNGNLEFAGAGLIAGLSAPAQAEGEATFDINGNGKIIANGDLKISRATTLGVNVEGTGALIANANIVNNGTIANDVTINADKSFENKGTLSGAVTNNGTLTSALAGLTGSVTNNSVMNLTGGTLSQDMTISGTGTNNVSGNLDLADKTLTADVTLADGSALAFNYDSSAKVAGTVTLAGKSDLKATIAAGEASSHQFADAVDASAEDAEWNVVDNSLYNLSLSDDNTTLSIEKKSSSEISESTGADANQAAAISSVIDGADTGNAAFDSVANNINEMLQSGDDAQVKAALDLVTAMSPEAAPMVVSVSTENVAQVFSAIASRLSGGTLASANQGMSSGDSLFEKGAAWVQGLFNHAKLDKTANNDGFKADTAGLALGFEKQVSDETKVGLGYAYNNSDVKSTMRKTDVDTHSVFAYGEYKPSNWFVNGMLSHNWSRYDEKTPVSTAKHDAETLGLQMMTGYNMLMGNVTVTPEAGLRYVHVDQDAYTTSLGANVGGDKSDILTGVMGVNVAKNWNLDNGMTLKPEARLALTYDIKHDATNSTVLLPNGSSYTIVGKALERFGVEAGLGLTAEINDNVELSVGYEGKFRDDYRDHTGLLNLKYKF